MGKIIKTAEFTVKKEKLDECLEAIKIFVAAVKKEESDTLLYESYQKDNPTEFIHIMEFKDSIAEENHRNTVHVKKFVSILYPNCQKEPIFTNLHHVL